VFNETRHWALAMKRAPDRDASLKAGGSFWEFAGRDFGQSQKHKTHTA